jgi:hypothetical protein
MPSKLPNIVLRNRSGKQFDDGGPTAGAQFREPRQHRGAAFGDLNNDGRVDVVVTCLNQAPEIWMNRSPGAGHWLLIKLIGAKSNREGVGTKIKLTPDRGPVQYNHASTSVGFSSSSDDRVHFGLGPATVATKIELTWPSGKRQVLENVRADQVIQVKEEK